MRSIGSWIAAMMTLGAFALPAQDTLPGSRITNAGVVRANGATDSVFIKRLRTADTVDIGDFAAYLLARIGAPPFDDSLGFRVTSDTAKIRISGRLMDFPPDSRAELGPIFSFLDSTSVFVAEVSMRQADNGIMRFWLDRVTVRGFAIPDLLLLVALNEYSTRYPGMLQAGGRAFDVGIPLEATARLIPDAIVLVMKGEK
ncbi:MAG: hypothetical protein ACREL5_12060 [Gemmatimonadales bacterium]